MVFQGFTINKKGKVRLEINRNWDEGDTFISLSVLDQILSAEFLSSNIDINQINLTP